MVAYRIYFIGDDGHFQKVRTLECVDDDAVIAEAKKLLVDGAIEVWHLARMVVRLEHKRK